MASVFPTVRAAAVAALKLFGPEPSERAPLSFSRIYAISNGEQVYDLVRNWYPEKVDPLTIRPYDDYFNVFAYRPGGLTGKWCDGNEDDLFSQIGRAHV